MNILLTGGTGFIGSHLRQLLQQNHHQVTLLSRKSTVKIASNESLVHDLNHFTHLNQFDAVINLAGEPIFAKRWTKARKEQLIRSRIELTQKLAQLINQSTTPPHTFISASATGYYGNLSQVANEQTPHSACFTGKLCQEWEQAALSAQSRVCVIRTGLVLSPQGGMLKQILPLYRFGLGGKLGKGKQHWAWISLHDHLQAVLFLLKNANCAGAFNLVAPEQITQAQFNQILAKHLHRSAFCHTPAFILKIMLGERAQLLLDNQSITPTTLLSAGFQFTDIKFSDYLAKI